MKVETFKGVVFDASQNYFLFSSNLNKYYVSIKDHPYNPGDILSIQGELEEIRFSTLESSFDFNEYLHKKGIKYQISTPKIKVVFQNPIKIKVIKDEYLSHFSGSGKALMSGLLFGKSTDDSTVNSIVEMHLYKIIFSSGFYLMIFFHFFVRLFSFHNKEKISRLIAIVILTFLTIFTFPRFSCLRVLILFILRWINDYLLKKKFSYIQILSFSGLLFLFIDPYLAVQDSFILGYGFPLFLFILRPAIRQFNGWKKKIIVVALTYLFFLPFEILYDHSIAPISVILNTLLLPLFIPLAIMGLLAFFRIPIYPLINGFSGFISKVISIIRPISLEIYARPLNNLESFLFYAFLIAFIYYLARHFKPIYKFALGIILASVSFNFLPVVNVVSDEASFINVGQGDSCLIRKGTTTVMIDTGGLSYKDIAKETLIPFLEKKRIYNIDLLITTHNDFDHNGGAPSLISNFRVKRYVTNYLQFPITANGITFTNYNTYIESDSEDNDNSLVIGFKLHRKNYLVMGDAPKETEEKIIKDNPSLKCDILKVGHHGSKTSTSEKFIAHLKPKEAVISCGYQNIYGHPHKSVIDILNKYKVKIRRTDQEGTIKYRNYIFT